MKLNLQTQSIAAGAWRVVLSSLLMAAFGGGLPPVAQAQVNYRLIVSFGSGNIPSSGQSSLIEGNDGRLYGTSYSGGNNGRGTVFRVNKDGGGFALLRSFTGGRDGGGPQAALVEGSDRALYGTTSQGGATDDGTVFKLNKDGSGYAVSHNFAGYPNDGAYPQGSLVTARGDGALYGTAIGGGAKDSGTVFKLSFSASRPPPSQPAK